MLTATFQSFGAPESVVSLEEQASLRLTPGHVRVRLLAAPINPADINYIQGVYGVKPELPASPGMEGCGEVIESTSPMFSIDDKVIFLKRGGLWKEEIITAAKDLIAVPAELDPLQACMLGINPLTALLMLEHFRLLTRGQCVIQNAANSNVGRCLLQIAKKKGIVTINVVRRSELFRELEVLGADHVLLDDSNLKQQVRALGLAPSLAINCVGGDSALRQISVLAEEGVQVTYGAMSKKAIKVSNGAMIFKRLRLEGFWVTKWLESAERSIVQEAYQKLAHMVIAGELAQAIDTIYHLSDVQEALSHAQQEQRRGKILLRFGS